MEHESYAHSCTLQLIASIRLLPARSRARRPRRFCDSRRRRRRRRCCRCCANAAVPKCARRVPSPAYVCLNADVSIPLLLFAAALSALVSLLLVSPNRAAATRLQSAAPAASACAFYVCESICSIHMPYVHSVHLDMYACMLWLSFDMCTCAPIFSGPIVVNCPHSCCWRTRAAFAAVCMLHHHFL